jgi:hypothetical protein
VQEKHSLKLDRKMFGNDPIKAERTTTGLESIGKLGVG